MIEETEKTTILDNVRLWWKFDGRYYHKNFIHGVKNLWRWFPTIWKDRNYGQSFIYDILSKKLEFQSEYIGKRDFHTRAKRDAEVMMLVTRLIKKSRNEDYGMEYMDYQVSSFDFVEIDDTYEGEKLYRLVSEEKSERYDEYFKKYPRQYKRVLSGEVNRFRREGKKDKSLIAMEIAHENEERCRKLLFKIMEQNIERWWD